MPLDQGRELVGPEHGGDRNVELGGVDAAQLTVRDRRADDGGVEEAGLVDVVGEAAPAGEQAADPRSGGGVGRPRSRCRLRDRADAGVGREGGPGVDHRRPDVDVAGAAAEVAAEDLVDSLVDGDALLGSRRPAT